MATKKRKCPDCGAKLEKAEKKGSKQCPECLLFIDKNDKITRAQTEAADKPDPVTVSSTLNLDHISRGLMAHPNVTVYAWPIGIQGNRGYRYGTQSPYPDPPWKKKMSGLEAFRFLSNIRNSNRRKKLESFNLPEMESD